MDYLQADGIRSLLSCVHLNLPFLFLFLPFAKSGAAINGIEMHGDRTRGCSQVADSGPRHLDEAVDVSRVLLRLIFSVVLHKLVGIVGLCCEL